MMTEKSLKKVLVANRGEIAIRVMRALEERGIGSVAVYSEADRCSPHVLRADEAYCLGPAPSAQSYLRGEAIVELAERVGADAIHPGYGFLSERAEFARLCEQAKIAFVGPSSQAISAMGSKIESRKLMTEAGVPVVPGDTEPVQDLASAQRSAAKIGYPVMLKASAGGGGKGMRHVLTEDGLASAFRAATSEAAASFGDSSVYLERYVEQPRHVEVQILGDMHGTVVSLGERECSIQRRHQKVVEEAPSTVVDVELRRRMGEAATRAGEAVGYAGAGTVEFLLEPGGKFYFLEMNTRLQVEHPVTEMVTGIDLVHAQLDIVEGRRIPEEWRDLQPRGHAIEVRLYAENPFRGFSPSPGRISCLRLPDGPGVRNDSGVIEGGEVSIHYDPMLGKLIVWGSDRATALRRLSRALDETRIDGIETTVPFFRQLMRDPEFLEARFDIGWLDRRFEQGTLGQAPDPDPEDDLPLIAAAIEVLRTRGHTTRDHEVMSRGTGSRNRWRQASRHEGLRKIIEVRS